MPGPRPARGSPDTAFKIKCLWVVAPDFRDRTLSNLCRRIRTAICPAACKPLIPLARGDVVEERQGNGRRRRGDALRGRCPDDSMRHGTVGLQERSRDTPHVSREPRGSGRRQAGKQPRRPCHARFRQGVVSLIFHITSASGALLYCARIQPERSLDTDLRRPQVQAVTDAAQAVAGDDLATVCDGVNGKWPDWKST